jgi:hypothetical protein
MLVPRGAAAAVALALMGSALAGFATGTAGGAGERASPPRAAAPEPAVAATASYPRVDRVIDRLNARRSAARRRLRAADTPGEQAAAAKALKNAYRDAYEGVTPRAGARAELAEQLDAVAQAYGLLVAAARSADAATWRAARERTLDRERDLELMLRTRPWT